MQMQISQPKAVRTTKVAPAHQASAAPLRAAVPRRAASRHARPVQRLAPVAAAADVQKQMAANEARWENQVRAGKVQNVMASEIKALMEDGWVLLDVRPPHEVEVVRITNATTVPLFVADTSMSPGSLLKQASAYGMGGWWLGGTHMLANKDFMTQVQAQIPKDAKVIIGCQKGLRSLAACEQLSRAGYTSLAWVNGGFDTARKGDLATDPADKDIRYAGIGGVSSILGWTEVQQEDGAGVLGGALGAIKLVAVVLVLDLLLFAWEQLQYLQSQQ